MLVSTGNTSLQCQGRGVFPLRGQGGGKSLVAEERLPLVLPGRNSEHSRNTTGRETTAPCRKQLDSKLEGANYRLPDEWREKGEKNKAGKKPGGEKEGY